MTPRSDRDMIPDLLEDEPSDIKGLMPPPALIKSKSDMDVLKVHNSLLCNESFDEIEDKHMEDESGDKKADID